MKSLSSLLLVLPVLLAAGATADSSASPPRSVPSSFVLNARGLIAFVTETADGRHGVYPVTRR